MKLPAPIARVQEYVKRRWNAAKASQRWLSHAVVAWEHYRDNHGRHFAAALTYFSFLAIFPLLLLVVSVLGFVLGHNPDLLQKLLDKITTNLPGDFGTTVTDSINTAIDARASIGVIALVGLLLTGLGWIGNLRAAINAVWGVDPPKRNFFLAKAANLIILVGLGIAFVVSIGLTVLGTAFTDKILRAIEADGVSGVHTLAQVVGILLAVLGDVLIFGWLLVGLARVHLPAKIVFRGALLAAAGFEALKIIGAYYIARVTRSPAAGVFGSIIGILIWIDLVSRYLLYCAAWTATAQRAGADALPVRPEGTQPPDAAQRPAPVPPRGLSPLAIAGSLFAAGAAAGGGAVAWLARRRVRVNADRR